MHRQFRKLLENAKGISQYIIAIVIDIRGFTPFCQTVDSVDVATYIKKVYIKIIDACFPDASFYKPTGDGLVVVIPYTEESLKEVMKSTMESCLNLLQDFGNLCKNEHMINFDTPNKIGIGITRGSACCITSEDKILDYSGKVLNLASRLMDVARPSGIVFDSSFGFGLLSKEKQELFSEEAIYVRGIAEEKPITVYYSNKYTLIPASYKEPIKEPKWENVRHVTLFEKFKLLEPNLILTLKGKPLDKKRIAVRIMHPGIEGYDMNYHKTVKDKEIDYQKRGRRHLIFFEVKPLVKLFESAGAKEGTPITFDIDYPVE